MPSTLILVTLVMDVAPPTMGGPQASPGPLWGEPSGRDVVMKTAGSNLLWPDRLFLPTCSQADGESEAATGMRREA